MFEVRWALAVLLVLGQQPTFRSGTQIVQVDVRVSKDGKFVTDLKPEDFQILEDGAAQKIVGVTLISDGRPSASAPSTEHPTPSTEYPAPATEHPAPSTQHPAAFWLFVFDTNHLSPGGLTRTRDAVVKFIAERFRKGDVGGVVINGAMVNNRLTSDVEELKKAASSVKMPGELRSRQLELREWPRLQDDDEVGNIANGDDAALKSAVLRACNEDPDQCRKLPVDVLVLEKARRLEAGTRTATTVTLKSIEALGNGLARIEGSKNVIFVSDGFYLKNHEAELKQATGMIARAGAHIYSIDARGLNRGSASSDIIDQAVVSSAFGAQQKFDTQTDGTNALAVDTGGFAIRNENNFGRALADIQADASTYYVVSYAPANEKFDGKYRSIDVKVDRAGVKVRARRGYLALEPAALLRPTGAVSAAVPPKRASEEISAKADARIPELPLSPGVIALSELGNPISVAPTDNALRVRVDKEMMTLGRATSAARSEGEVGWSAYEKGDVETAAKHLELAAKAPAARPWVLYALGLAQFAQRKYQEAAAAWERVRTQVPEFETIYFSLADAYGLQHDDGTAIKVLRDAERRWPTDPEVANALGVIQVKRGAIDAAIESFTRATTVAPADGLGYFNLGRTLQMRWGKRQRYDRERERWIGPDDDRKGAVAAFQKYLELGGPYERQAREALAALGWS